jgi:hypothetical protein
VILVEEDDIARLGTSIGNYRLDKILGRGGMGTVYSGEHIYIKKPVAVKVLHPQFARYQEAIHRFLREARAATSINHPNIVDVTDFGILADGPCTSDGFLDGKSLEDLIEVRAVEPPRAQCRQTDAPSRRGPASGADPPRPRPDISCCSCAATPRTCCAWRPTSRITERERVATSWPWRAHRDRRVLVQDEPR